MTWLPVALFGTQVALLTAFAFFAAFNYLYGLAALRTRRVPRVRHSGSRVAVVIVSYNEKYVLPETIRSCEALTYPNAVVLLSDDSDDPEIETTLGDLARAAGCRPVEHPERVLGPSTDDTLSVPCEIWESERFVYIHRSANRGYKGGNLRLVSAYLRARGINLMYLVDADWHPQPDAIERSLEALEADDRIAFVQTKRLTREQGMTRFQRYVSISEEGCYHVDFEGRQAMRHPILFSGCCTLLRLDAVEAVGGFASGHLTEDLDVTNRLWLEGWKGVYCGDVVNWGEVPFSYPDFRRQQERWAYGTARCLADHAWPLLRCEHLTWIERLSALRQNAYFSTGVLSTAAIAMGMGTVAWLAVASGRYDVEYYLYLMEHARTPVLAVVYACILSTVVEPLVMIVAKKRRPAELLHLPMGIWYAWSVLPTYVVGTLKGLAGVKIAWFRTPKFIRGRLEPLSRLSLTTRAVNVGLCLAMIGFYAVEGWAFGWRDPFALLLLPAFLLAASR